MARALEAWALFPPVSGAKSWPIHYQGTKSQDKHYCWLNPHNLLGGGGVLWVCPLSYKEV